MAAGTATYIDYNCVRVRLYSAAAECQEDRITSSDTNDKRVALRQAVLKGAQIVYGQTVVDCLVLNVSDTGARVRTAAVIPIPDRVSLRFRGGAVFTATRRWTRGMEIGFSFDGASSLGEAPARVAWQIYEAVRASSLAEPMRLLRTEKFFDDAALRAMAEEAETALLRLEAALAARARSSGAAEKG